MEEIKVGTKVTTIRDNNYTNIPAGVAGIVTEIDGSVVNVKFGPEWRDRTWWYRLDHIQPVWDMSIPLKPKRKLQL